MKESSSPKLKKSNDLLKSIADYKTLSKWSIDAVAEWLVTIDYEDAVAEFRAHRINGLALLMLNEDDMKEIIAHNVGQRKNLYHVVRVLQIRYNRCMNSLNASFISHGSLESDFDIGSSTEEEEEEEEEAEEKEENEERENEVNKHLNDETSQKNMSMSSSNGKVLNESFTRSAKNNKSDHHISYDNPSDTDESLMSVTDLKTSTQRHLIQQAQIDQTNNETPRIDKPNLLLGSAKSTKSRHHHHKNQIALDTDQNDHGYNQLPNFCENCLKKFDRSPYTSYAPGLNGPIRSSKGEKRKTILSVFYLFLTCLWTAFMLTVVHDRVPDMQKYPPLPDIILDNVPLIPWAFFATELIGLFLGITILIILFFHKYRLIIFRRICSLGGTIFFLRSITMLITSLSVPGIHIQCSSQRYGSLMNKLYGAWNILSGVGLYVQGVRTCGDYMFSGHTVWLTLTTHFITEYTPPSMTWLHTGTWILNVFGLFFILGAHEHYSIDVFVAFYITSRLFLYYHSLANNKALFQRDHKRVKVWFPLFSYFESNIHSIVPNEYECPTRIFNYMYKFIKNRVIKRIFGAKSKSKSIHQKTS